MKKYSILALAPLFVFNACNKSDNKIQQPTKSNSTPTVTKQVTQNKPMDTLRVIGTYNMTLNATHMRKFIRCTDKKGNEIDMTFEIYGTPKQNITYTERGDTIVLQNKEFIKNITQERLKKEFAHTK